MGRHNVMDPLHQFGFSDSNNQEHFCHLYSYINGVLLDDYFKERTISQIFLITARVLPNIIRGMIYLYNAGIIHNDMSPKNIMLEQDSIGRMIGLKIIDFDLVEVFEKEQGWQPIHPRNREEFSYNPIQRYKSCNGLHFMIVEFLDIFVNPHKTEDPFAHNYVLTGRAAQNYCTRLKRSQNIRNHIDNENVMTLAQHDHTILLSLYDLMIHHQ
ncbi:hypothetical protein BDF22DRAFT_735230 [Syncephalis plumigaleata]|nr:hypothetical protein BDF22DRAFT_735230 [Syncephalis plumigaleata]